MKTQLSLINSDALIYLKKLPLHKLRKRQEILRLQQQYAYKHKNTNALIVLGAMDRQLIEAIMSKI